MDILIKVLSIINAIPVLREKEYGWTEIEKMLNEILIELDEREISGNQGKTSPNEENQMAEKEKALRDEIAISALNGMLAHSTRYKPREGAGVDWHISIAREAYELADAMLKVRNNKPYCEED